MIPTSTGPGHVEVEGCLNFRDAGGWPCRGGHLKRNRLFRADDPIRITETGRARVEALGVSAVIDLRQHHQYVRSEGFVADRNRVHHRPLVDKVIDIDAPPSLGRPEDLTDVYDGMLERSTTQLADVVDLIADHISEGAVIVHCAFGKDRTGLVIALVHAALGVSAADIAADYARSNGPAQCRRAWILASLRPDDPPLARMPEYLFTAPAEAMEVLLQRMTDRYGSLQAWAESLPLTRGSLHALRRHLVQPD